MPHVRIGISGWTYTPWRGKFYPKGLPQRLELAYASRRFSAIEVNGTFYSLQRPESYQAWHDQTPPGFVFALKGGRYITHMRKLKEPRQPLANFFASGPLRLRDKLGPILWQFPPFVPFDESRFEAFFDLLPRNTGDAARLGRQHSPFLRGRVELHADARRPLRHAVEFRHPSFLSDRFVRLLRRYNIAMVIADVAGKFPTAEDITADWIYIRLHGSRRLYASGYSPRELEQWAAKVRTWNRGSQPPRPRRIGSAAPSRRLGRDIYVFFDNTDVKLRAPIDARRLAGLLKVGPSESPARVLRCLGVPPAP